MSPFAEMTGSDDECTAFPLFLSFVKSMIKAHVNPAYDVTKQGFSHCMIDFTAVPSRMDSITLLEKNTLTKTSKIYGMVPFSGGSDGGDGDDGTSGSFVLMPSIMMIVAGLFLTGRRGLAFIVVVFAAVASAQAYVPISSLDIAGSTQFFNLSDTVNFPDISQAYWIDLTFTVNYDAPADWCDKLTFMVYHSESCYDDDDKDCQSFEIMFKPVDCSNPQTSYPYYAPFRIAADFQTREACLPDYVYIEYIVPSMGNGYDWSYAAYVGYYSVEMYFIPVCYMI